MSPIARLFTNLGKLTRLTLLAVSLVFLYQSEGHAQTCTLSGTVIASNNPFAACPPGTDTIVILDTFIMDVNYEPLFNGVPFDGFLILDGGVLHFTSNCSLRLGSLAKILMFNGGHIFPGMTGELGCNGSKTIFFDMFKLASCNGFQALHSFADVNAAGCFDGSGICCNAAIIIEENSGFPNDKTLCTPGDSVTISVVGSGSLMYDYLWTPNIGPENGPYKRPQFVNTTYSVQITGLFDPEGPEPAYLLGCSGSVTVNVNPTINTSTSVTPVPCASAAIGAVDLMVTGGTAPYKYNWSNGKTTQDINGLTAGTYTCNISDARGCGKVVTVTVNTQDNIPPTLSCPANAAGIAQPGLCTTTIPGIDATFSDNCPAAALSYEITGATTATGAGQLSNVFPFQSGVNNVKYLVSDGSNTVNCTFTVTVTDNQLPTASNPATITGIQCFDDLPAPDPAVVTTEADNCGTPTVTYINQSVIGGLSCPGNPLIISRRYRVTDAAGNSITVTQQIQVADSTPPSFTSVPANTTVNCQSIPAIGTATAVDNCTGAVTVTYMGETRTNGPCADTYTLTRTWRATDNCGNSSTATQTIAVQDVISPVFSTVPPNITVNCESVPAPGSTSATDNCDANVSIVYLGETRVDGSCPGAYTLTRTWRADDNCGNTATAQQFITVVDITKPTFSAVPANVTVSCDNIPAVGTATATDNCDASVTVTYVGETRTNGACTDSYTLTRTWNAADDCGNTATGTQLITVQDIVSPVITSTPANVTVSCDAVPLPGTPTATDNCDTDVTITFDGETRVGGVCPFTYVLTRTWTATDNCGNTKTTTQVLTVQDLENPTFTSVPADVTVSCNNIPSLGSATATDNCDPSVVVAYIGETRVDGPCTDTYTLLRRWRATDRCGNTTTATQTISVQDIEAPTFTSVPVAVTVSCDNIPAPGTPLAIDNCDAAVTITYDGQTRTDGNCANNYTLTRIWTAADNCGNTTTATQLLTVQDLTAPVFTSVPANVTASCEALPAVGTPTASDNCTAAVTITYLGENIPGSGGGACQSNYEIIRTWQATDECGNTTTATQTITVQDVTAPVVTFVPADTTVSCSGIPPVGTPAAIDNCDASLTITYSGATRINGTCPNSYTLHRDWVIADDCGNTSTARQVLTVEDTTAPVYTFVPADVTVSCEAVPQVGNPEATDNCAAAVTITYNGAVRTDGACPDSYTLARSWTAVDSCGNSSVATQIITVQDITAPNFTMVPADVTVNCESIPAVEFPTAADNCDQFVTIAYAGQVRFNGPCTHTYTLKREWTATDNCGNTSTTTQTITVQDITPPQFLTVPADVTVSCEAVPGAGTPTAADNCDADVTITYAGEERTDGNCVNNYTLKRTWVATDDCGNTKTAFQTIKVQDLTKPVFTFVPADTTVNCNDIPFPDNPQATDNCTANPVITFVGETILGSMSPDSYTLERKWTATDECNNVTTAIQLLEVQDTVAPAITCPDNIDVDANGATCSAIVSFNDPLTADNCAATLNVVSTATSGQAFGIGTTIVTMQVTDPTGNSASCTFMVVVRDTTPPVLLNCPPDITVTTSPNTCDAQVNWTAPTVTDPCDQYAITPTPTIANGTVLPTGIHPVVYTAVDSTGNSTQCSFTVTVREEVPPVLLNCPADITVTTTVCTAEVSWTPPNASDNCGLDTVFVNIEPGATFQETTTLVQYTAVDEWGNTTTCTFNVTVVDLVPPVFSGCPDDIEVNAGVCFIPISWTQPTATDNCDADPTVYSIPEPGDAFPAGFTTVHVFVVDPSGNQDTCTFVVHVIGPPLGLVDLPGNQSFIGCDAIATWIAPKPTGVCGPYELTSNWAPGDTFPIGVTPVTYTLTDTLGQMITHTFTITVTESVPPQFVCPASPIRVNIAGQVILDPSDFIGTTDTISTCDGVELGFGLPLATDNCLPPVVTQTSGPLSNEVFDLGQHLLSFLATDSAGNTATCVVNLEVLPLLPLNPQVSDVIACKGDLVTLSATPINDAAYIWNGPAGPYPDNNNIVIESLEENLTGYYTVYANVRGCLTPIDSALVRIGKLPDAIDDLDYQIGTNETLTDFNILLNDIYETDDYTLTVASPLQGLINHGNGFFSFEAGNKNTVNYFVYTLCSKTCPDLCDEGIVAIQVRERVCSFIPNIITPNGDNTNDYLVIPCLDIEPYPQNSLVIYNQWGDRVYEAAPYDNAPDKAWKGELFGEPGKGLPDATYFYIFKAAPDDPGLKGFIEVFR